LPDFSDLRNIDYNVACVLDNIDFQSEGLHITVVDHLSQPHGYDNTGENQSRGILYTYKALKVYDAHGFRYT